MRPIDPERWRILSPYLDQALDIAADQRPEWLAGICARDAVLGRELKAMLAEHNTAHDVGFLSGAVLESGAMRAAQSLSGQVVGAYRLLSLIGQGGSGTVWVAERCGAVLWRRERAGGEGNRRSAPDRNRAVDKQAQCRRVLVLGAHLEDGFENVVEVLGKLAVEALAGGFGQADDIAFWSAIRVAAAPFGCTHFWTSFSAGQNLTPMERQRQASL